MIDSAYAARCRDAVRPAECTRAPECWADHGGSERIARCGGGVRQCAACDGKLVDTLAQLAARRAWRQSDARQ